MSWNPYVEVHYCNTSYPYNSAGSFMEYFDDLTYEHVNFIFDGASHVQESVYPLSNTSFYKFGLSEYGSNSYYDYGHSYGVNYHEPGYDAYRGPSENTSRSNNEQNAAVNMLRERSANTTTREIPVECPQRHHNSYDYQELLELDEPVGTQSRGLSQELIAQLPISKYKCGFFARKKSRHERCVICQMEYKRGDWCMTLPCKHVYHTGCGSRWLSINKACPICCTEVFGDSSKHSENIRR